jgi:predicted DNA binding CopG/RHH family protein
MEETTKISIDIRNDYLPALMMKAASKGMVRKKFLEMCIEAQVKDEMDKWTNVGK